MWLRLTSCAMCFVGSFAVGGCGSPFLHSAASSGASVRDPGLVGEWVTRDDTVARAVIDSAGDQYTVSLTVHHKGEFKSALKLELNLTDIGEARYADLFLSRDDRDKLVGTYGFLAVPVHQVMKLSRSGNELRVWTFDGSWLEGQTKAGLIGQERVTVGGDSTIMITGSTEAIRQMLAKYGNDPKAFDDPMIFYRVSN